MKVVTHMHKFCDGCGALLKRAPLVRHTTVGAGHEADDTTYQFDTFECYERARGNLGLMRDKQGEQAHT